MVITPEKLEEMLSKNHIKSGELANFTIETPKGNVESLLDYLGNHTAFKLSHGNGYIESGYTEYGQQNYSIDYTNGVLSGNLLIEPTVAVKDLYISPLKTVVVVKGVRK